MSRRTRPVRRTAPPARTVTITVLATSAHGAAPLARSWYRRARAPRPAVASDARPLGGARLGGDAPPDAGAARRRGVATSSSARSPTPRGDGGRRARRGDRGLGPARLPAPRATALGSGGACIDARRLARRPHRRCPASGATPRPRVAAQADDADVPAVEVNIRRVVERVDRRAARPSAEAEDGDGRDRRGRSAAATGCSRSWTSARSLCRPREPALRRVPAAATVRDARRARRRGAVPGRRRSRAASGSGAAR